MSKPKFKASERVKHSSGVLMRVIRLLGQTKEGINVYQCISPSDNLHEVFESSLSKVKGQGKVVK